MKGKRNKENKEKKSNWLVKFIKVAVFIILVGLVINIAPNYIQDKDKSKTSLIINNNNVTDSLKYDVLVDENDVVYLSSKDIANFFDGNIYYDNVYDQIITTSDSKVATIGLNKKEMYVNSSKVNIYATAKKQDGTFYLPFSEMSKIYNVEIKYSKDSKIVTIDSLEKEQKMGNSSKEANVKYKPTIFSKTVAKVKAGESVVVLKEENGWYKIRTSNGNIGYLKDVANIYKTRDNMEEEKQIEGKVSLVWDYYTRTAPTRTGTIDGINVVSPSVAKLKDEGEGELSIRIGDEGVDYINWAHQNGYKVWGMIQSDGVIETTSKILNDYRLRENLINNIVKLAVSYSLDGVNIDFEYMKETDKDMFSRFIIELSPRLKEYGKVLTVDVTAPDGSPEWSLCYNRYKIAQVADYIIFMAYDQNGISSPKEGTTAGADWVEANVKKFLGQEGVSKDKLILAMPFYTRLWKETSTGVTSSTVLMKSIDATLPEGIEKVWDEDLKQYYVEYTQNGATYKMWLEEENSIRAKFDIMNKYELAGAAYWQKDFESSNIWNIVSENIK